MSLRTVANVLERILQVTHGYNAKQMVTCLKGGRVEPLKKYKGGKLYGILD